MHFLQVRRRLEQPPSRPLPPLIRYGPANATLTVDRLLSIPQPSPPRHPGVTLASVTDEPTPEDLEQLARSVAMSASLGDRDREEVIDALRRLAAIEKSKGRHPSGGA